MFDAHSFDFGFLLRAASENALLQFVCHTPVLRDIVPYYLMLSAGVRWITRHSMVKVTVG